jgi:hypothetical protein
MPTACPHSFELFLALQVCVQTRDKDAARLGLRRVATELDDNDGVRLTQLLSRSLDPQGRFWLANLLGERVAQPSER